MEVWLEEERKGKGTSQSTGSRSGEVLRAG